MSEPLLSARGLTRTYAMGKRALEVLRGIDLDVVRGESLALRGASGAGKSTLLHLIGGLDSPNAGEIHFARQNLAAFSENELTDFRNRRVGFVFQAYHLLPELNALENVCLPARLARLPPAKPERADAICSRGSASRTAWNTSPTSFPAANSSVSPSPAPSSTNRNCCWPTNRPAISIRTPAAKSSSCSKTSAPKNRPRSIIATHDAKVAAHRGEVVELVDGQIKLI